jgi:predicted nuclease of restriction endonuclease-like (RecB) superfamily
MECIESQIADGTVLTSRHSRQSRHDRRYLLPNCCQIYKGKAQTNSQRSLPPPDSDLAERILNDPYNFDFLTVAQAAQEREIERGLLTHLRDLLLKRGRGFAFVGSQVPLAIDGQTFYLDLVFCHVRLHCYFVFELKLGAFQPEHAGKLSFYLSAVNGPICLRDKAEDTAAQTPTPHPSHRSDNQPAPCFASFHAGQINVPSKHST